MTADVFLTSLTWLGKGRAHLYAIGRPGLQISHPLAFGGEPNKWAPEDLLTGAVEACVLMTFLYFVKRQQIELLRYLSHAQARIEKTRDGIRFTEISLTLEIGVASQTDVDKIPHALDLAERYCPVSHALNFPLHIERTVQTVTREQGEVLRLLYGGPDDERTTF